MKKKLTGVGASSVLMIFILLCLTIFGVLSLVSAQSDLKLTEKAKTSAENFYAADAITDKTIKELDEIFYGLSDKDFPSVSEYYASVSDKITDIAYIEEFNGGFIIFAVPLDENRTLRTIIDVLPQGSGKRYAVISRKIEVTAVFEEESYKYWDGK